MRPVARAREAAGIKRLLPCSLPTMRAAHRVYGRLGFARAPELDWVPLPGVDLWGFALEL